MKARQKRGWVRTAVVAAAGAAAAYLFDRRNGRRRRKMLRERPPAFFRKSERRAARAVRYSAAKARGLAARARHAMTPHRKRSYDDVTLAHKVESEVFRFRRIPKRDLNVSAAEGVVSLRGQIDSAETISEIIKKTKKVEGVRGVENLLHLPGTSAPHHENGPRSMKRS